ncbi:AN1-type zinc finger protein 5 [Astathelohania contejeani]|uniref:AN1-type zinc finger protein 5 n=1 Tax=Astathelohania contejeani TaxID=164912 RepID=A0ABQ7HZ31_9MICR|nr:AN1-type zinc finger protein 5 [Thelohania contejeani]
MEKPIKENKELIANPLKRKACEGHEISLHKKARETIIQSSPKKQELSNTKAKLTCSKCGKKLRMTNSFKCKCGNIFCNIHRFYDEHSCTFDYRSEAMEKLRRENPLVINKKI